MSTDRNFLAYHNTADDSVTSAVLTRDEWDARMFDLFNTPTVDRIWSADRTDGVCRFEWVRADEENRDEWGIIHDGQRYTFAWIDDRETVHCTTLGEGFGKTDPFGQTRWVSPRMAVQWTLDNIERIASR